MMKKSKYYDEVSGELRMNTFSYISNVDFRKLFDENGSFDNVPVIGGVSSEEVQSAIRTLEKLSIALEKWKKSQDFDTFVLAQGIKLQKLLGDYSNLGVRELLEETARFYKEEEE